jgi:hypothetical protein
VDLSVFLAQVVRVVLLVVSSVIGLAILFVVLGANPSNSIVSDFLSWGHSLAGPFVGIFHLSSHKGTIALDYGLAILVYAIIAELIIGLLRAMLAPAIRHAAPPDGRNYA